MTGESQPLIARDFVYRFLELPTHVQHKLLKEIGFEINPFVNDMVDEYVRGFAWARENGKLDELKGKVAALARALEAEPPKGGLNDKQRHALSGFFERGVSTEEAINRVKQAEILNTRPAGQGELAQKWRKLAADSREEAGRIRRTVIVATDAESNCLVRAELWDKCADELESALAAGRKG